MKQVAQQAYEDKSLMRVGFFEALAAILKDQPVILADDNPFKPYVVKLVEAIDVWKRLPHRDIRNLVKVMWVNGQQHGLKFWIDSL